MKFNMNNYVSVTLTKRGTEIYNARWEGLRLPEEYIPKPASEGYVLKAQLWSLFQDFGEHIYLGCHMPFEGCTLSFDNAQFEKE